MSEKYCFLCRSIRMKRREFITETVLIMIFLVAILAPTVVSAEEVSWSKGREGHALDPAVNPEYRPYDWPDTPPEDCPLPQSAKISRIRFTGRYANYTGADTWYPMWASDGEQYSTWTDGSMWTNRDVPYVECPETRPGREMYPWNTWSFDPPAPQLYNCYSGPTSCSPTSVGLAKIVGDSPLNLDVIALGRLYSGRCLYPCINLIANDWWYIGSYQAFDIGGRFNGFRYSNDWDRWVEEGEPGWSNPYWTDTRTEKTDFFAQDTKPRRFNVPHAVVFGQNNKLSPDGKAYFTAHGMIPGGRSNWDKGDGIYLCRSAPEPVAVTDPNAYEFFVGHDASGKAIWSNDVRQSRPILKWKNHLGSEGLTYIPGLDKYLLMTARLKEHEKNLPYDVLIFWEADKITGPYRMVHYLRDWGPQTYFPNIPAKFISPDGKTMWLCASSNYSSGKYDPVSCRYSMTLHEIVLDMPGDTWAPPLPGRNLAMQATATSSDLQSNPAGVNDGKRQEPAEMWSTTAGVGAWVRLSWDTPQRISAVRLWDLPAVESWVLRGTLSFSDGSKEPLNAWLSNRSYAPGEISFAPKEVTWVQFTIDQGSGTPLGLAEFEILSVPGPAAPRTLTDPEDQQVKPGTASSKGEM